MTTIDVYRPVPTAGEAPPQLVLAERRSLAGARLVIINNGKPRTGELLGAIAAELTTRYSLGSVQLFSKPSASAPITAEQALALATTADVALTGLGDCAGCSACSLQDALIMERNGRPATVVISEPFQSLIASFSSKLGALGYPVTVVPHPVSSRSSDELARVAAQVAATVAGHLSDVRAGVPSAR